jgi:hypothetical protein
MIRLSHRSSHTHLQVVRFCLKENIQTKATRPPANLQKSVSAQPGKRNFQKCPTLDEKEGQNNDTDRQMDLKIG